MLNTSAAAYQSGPIQTLQGSVTDRKPYGGTSMNQTVCISKSQRADLYIDVPLQEGRSVTQGPPCDFRSYRETHELRRLSKIPPHEIHHKRNADLR